MLKGLRTIRSKLVLSFVLSMTIVSLILGSFFWVEYKQKEIAEISSSFETIKLETKEISIHEKDFFSIDIFDSYFFKTRKSPNLKLHQERLTQLRGLLGELKRRPDLEGTEVKQRIESLSREIDEFEDNFAKVVDQVFVRGGQDYGLMGEMLTCIRTVEDAPIDLDTRQLLRVRRMEKDFFLRLDTSYILKLDQIVSQMQQEAKRITSGPRLREISQALDCYLSTFHRIAIIDLELGLRNNEGKRAKLSSSWEIILGQIDSLEMLISKKSILLKHNVQIIHAILLFLFLVLNIFSLFMLFNQLGSPIRRLSRSITATVESDFKPGVEVLKWKSRDEIGQLSGDVSKMLDKIREKTKESDRQKEQLRSSFKNLELLSKLGKKVTSKLQVRDIVEFTYENLNKLLDAPVFAIGKIEKESDILDYWYVETKETGFDLDSLLDTHTEEDHASIGPQVKHGRKSLTDKTSLATYCFEHQTKIHINDIDQDYQIYLQDVNLLHETNKRYSIIFIPLILEGKSIGVVTVQSYARHAYTDQHVSIIETIATYIAVALANAENFARIEQQAEEIQTSEEELRQNHEELQTINDQLEEAHQRTQHKNKELSILIEQLNRSKKIIEKKNLDITASINYAQRIQEAVLPRISAIQEAFPQSFLLFQPRDIVSGDFYWYATHRDKAIIIAADCTGHGVPGALMSVIGYSILNEIIKQDDTVAPDLILNELHINIRDLLRQDLTNNRDGMDIAICAIDLKPLQDGKRYIHFAGAKNNLYFIKDGDQELSQIKGNIVPIGGHQKEEVRIFTPHQVEIDRPMTFYICSDGYQDQFGGEKGKKFMIKRLKNQLFDIHQNPMEEQHMILLQAINKWMGKKYPQLDDILLFGAKIS